MWSNSKILWPWAISVLDLIPLLMPAEICERDFDSPASLCSVTFQNILFHSIQSAPHPTRNICLQVSSTNTYWEILFGERTQESKSPEGSDYFQAFVLIEE